MVTALLTALAIASVWLPALPIGPKRSLVVWPWMAGLAMLVAVVQGQVDGRGVAAVGLLGLLSYGALHAGHCKLRVACAWGSVGLAFALAVRAIPGFERYVLIDHLTVSADADPVVISANLDAGLAGLFLLAVHARRCLSMREFWALLPRTMLVAMLTTAVVMAAGVVAGFVRPDVKLPLPATALYGAKILFWTAVLEEAFFRGIIQDRLARMPIFQRSLLSKAVPVVISGSLFGVAHIAGGPSLMALAALAGVGYSLAYSVTGRIEASILTHFLLNLTHFVGFTYPHLAIGQSSLAALG